MRISVLGLALVALAACKEASTSAPPAQPPSASTTALSTATPPPVSTASGAPTPVSTAAPATAPLFTYVEGTDELAFWPPTTLRLRRAGPPPRTCTSELSTGADNMWTGPDVESAFADRDVQSALARKTPQSFLPEVDDGGAIAEGRLATTKSSLEWKLEPCHWCVPPPAGITRLHRVLAGVMMNRRLLCR